MSRYRAYAWIIAGTAIGAIFGWLVPQIGLGFGLIEGAVVGLAAGVELGTIRDPCDVLRRSKTGRRERPRGR